jgi:threonine synthase
VGKNIDDDKLKMLQRIARDKNISLTQVENPKQAAFQLDTRNEAKNLRQSTDDSALKGYASLANELAKIKNLSAVFIPTSSGTAAQGLYEGFKKMKVNPEIHIVQTVACHPIAGAVMMASISSPLSAAKSIASAIVDKIAHRKTDVAEAVKKSQGAGWVPDDEEIKSAINLVKKNTGISISASSALSVAGLIQAINNNWIFNGPVACLITGA